EYPLELAPHPLRLDPGGKLEEVGGVRSRDVERVRHYGVVREDAGGELEGLLEDPQDDQAHLASLPVRDDDGVPGNRSQPAPGAAELVRACDRPVHDRVRMVHGERVPYGPSLRLRVRVDEIP